jgi:hypothetical protein
MGQYLLSFKIKGGNKMTTYLIIINILAMIGIITIVYMIDEIKTDRKIKKEKARKEQMKKELLEIIDEIMEEEE